MIRLKARIQKNQDGFTMAEMLIGITVSTLIMGAASIGLRSTQTLISESKNQSTLRQNTQNGVRLMRSEIERGMNLIINRKEGFQEGEEETDLAEYCIFFYVYYQQKCI